LTRKADLADGPGLTQELAGCDAAFYLVHSMMSPDREYAEQDLILAFTFAKAALDAGVRRIIYLGGLGETGEGLSEHLSSRRDVEAALGSSGAPVTVLRAAMIVGSGSTSFEILRYLVRTLLVITSRWNFVMTMVLWTEGSISWDRFQSAISMQVMDQ
jgi:uncharacterized protein YbjT (DUF2867 family)